VDLPARGQSALVVVRAGEDRDHARR
jgi:hypothetical protein